MFVTVYKQISSRRLLYPRQHKIPNETNNLKTTLDRKMAIRCRASRRRH